MRKFVTLSIVAGVMLTSTAAITLTMSKDCAWQAQTDMPANNPVVVSQIPQQCDASVTEVSWLSWLAGKSSSYQFHFLDLLELLHGSDRSNRQPVSPVH
ncbi:hypothetical protein [Alteromonas sp. CYL-A6]|uniref:hypothetical protein n=1 Tax=Alteromonas nitratireducens TaxID=3390813 RepID=UPI0034C38C5F